jgi:hypothetical protein
MLDIQFRSCLKSDLVDIQLLVDNLFLTYPPEDGFRPNIGRTYNEFMRFP